MMPPLCRHVVENRTADLHRALGRLLRKLSVVKGQYLFLTKSVTHGSPHVYNLREMNEYEEEGRQSTNPDVWSITETLATCDAIF